MKRMLIISVALFLMGAIGIGLILINRPAPTEINLDEIIIESESVAFGSEIANSASLNLLSEGNGAVEVSPYETAYPAGTRVKLSPHPHEGWIFVGWSGDVPERLLNDSEIIIPLYEGVYNIIAIFVEK